MRIISVFLFLVIILLFTFPLAAQSASGEFGQSAYVFSLTPALGFLWGRAEELVFQKALQSNSSPYISQLLWDFKPLVYVGIELEYGLRYPLERNGFHTNLSLKYGLPLSTGTMENRDWLSSTGNYLTNYSQHDAFSRSSLGDLFSGYGTFMADLSAGYSWAFINRIWLRAYGHLSYMRFAWMSRDGYTQYGPNDPGGSAFVPWSPEFPKIPYSGRAIGYTQNWVTFAPGMAGGIRITDYFSLSLFALCTPLLYGECKDEHFSRDFVFMDYLLGGLYFRGGGKVNYTLHRRVTFTFSGSFMNLSKARGNEVVFYRGKRISSSTDSVGGGFTFLDLSLSAKFTF